MKIQFDYTKFSLGYQLPLALDFPIMIPQKNGVATVIEKIFVWLEKKNDT